MASMFQEDFSLTTFSSKGKLLQIEYALEAVQKAETALGIRGKDCVVLAVEKKSSSILIDESSYHKVSNITGHLGATYAGLGPDFRVLMMKARKLTQQYWCKYRENISVNYITQKVAGTVQEFTQSGARRPFGNSILLCGYDDDGAHLMQIDPSGAFYEWKAVAVGENYKNAKEFLEKRYDPTLLLEDVIHTALLTLKEGFEGEMNSKNIEIAYVDKNRKFTVLTPNQIQDYLDQMD